MSKKKLIQLSEDDEKVILDHLKDYMSEEFDLDLGNLPAKFLLDFIIETVGPKLYDQVINDVEPWFYDRFIGILEDMHSLKKD